MINTHTHARASNSWPLFARAPADRHGPAQPAISLGVLGPLHSGVTCCAPVCRSVIKGGRPRGVPPSNHVPAKAASSTVVAQAHVFHRLISQGSCNEVKLPSASPLTGTTANCGFVVAADCGREKRRATSRHAALCNRPACGYPRVRPTSAAQGDHSTSATHATAQPAKQAATAATGTLPAHSWYVQNSPPPTTAALQHPLPPRCRPCALPVCKLQHSQAVSALVRAIRRGHVPTRKPMLPASA